MSQDLWDQQLNNLRFSSPARQLIPLAQQEALTQVKEEIYQMRAMVKTGLMALLILMFAMGGSAAIDPSVSNAILDEFYTSKVHDFQNPSDCLVGNFSTSQDIQSQITSASLADSQAFLQQDFSDSSEGTSSCNMDFQKSKYKQNNSWQQVALRVRTYTKV